ncbi:SDR family oxidoreductase [Hoeflea sp. TYP-13]|uniref:SDR family oxidoreductase n=1 Tax=Hoeflea sp. TYP-13 TaxID=3230023 RepID=UPI0034C63B0C
MRAIVTAAGSGIGKHITKKLRERGDVVFGCDIQEELLDGAGVQADVSDEASVDNMMAAALDQLGGIDLLVNVAGVAGPTGGVEELILDDWRRCLAVTLDGSFLCSRKAVPHMKRQGAGLIVNFSSTAGMFGYPGRSPYATAKWGIIGFTKSLAMELGPHGIRANAICPGAVSGDRMDRVIASEAEASGRRPEEIQEIYERSTSLRGFVSADDVANMVLFLASPGGAMISGQAIAVDGHTEYLTG